LFFATDGNIFPKSRCDPPFRILTETVILRRGGKEGDQSRKEGRQTGRKDRRTEERKEGSRVGGKEDRKEEYI
jgi:hypothetical protein